MKVYETRFTANVNGKAESLDVEIKAKGLEEAKKIARSQGRLWRNLIGASKIDHHPVKRCWDHPDETDD